MRNTRMQHSLRRLALAGTVLMLALSVASTATASPVVHQSVVSDDPADFTPRVITGEAVYKMVQAGGTLYAGGDFSVVANANRSQTYQRSHLFAFNASTGAVTSLSVSLDGPVWGLATDGASLWVGGNFRKVNGVFRRGLFKLNMATGQPDFTFNARLNGNVAEVLLANGRLIVGGKFTKRLQAVDPVSGADTGYLNLGITGSVADNAGATDVYRFAVNPAGTRLVAVGNFTQVSGNVRHRAFMVNLDATATLASWYYPPLLKSCRATRIPAQLRDVDFSPDGNYFVLVATGYIPRPGDQGTNICDATAKFNTNSSTPSWINYTGGDTLHSVAVTNAAVYIQGHQRWVGSSGIGCTPGCSERAGIAALAPSDGKALPWNPGKDRGVGGKDLLLTEQGLWVASDTTRIGGEIHERLAFMPLP